VLGIEEFTPMAGDVGQAVRDNSGMQVTPVVTGVLIGIVVGFPAGMLYAVARRSWKDHNTTKAGMPGLRKAAFARSREFVVFGFLLAVAAAIGIGATRR
jgi:ABC-type dipeptide/oligopeptide/nickel transport system permease component